MNTEKLSKFRIDKLPCTAYYIPNFITTEEEGKLLEKIYSAPKPKWRQLSNRRLQNWGGLPHPKGMVQEPLPEWLNNCMVQLTDLGIFGDQHPNHALVNEYLAGQGIMPHEDGPLFYPIVTTISLSSHTILDYYEKMDNEESIHEESKNLDNRYTSSLVLERCSLLICQDDLYHKYLHGIKESKTDLIDNRISNLSLSRYQLGDELQRGTRISITIRHVPKTVKLKNLSFLGIKFQK